MITVKASEFRKHLFAFLDLCIESGEEIRIPRKGGEVRIVPVTKKKHISQLAKRPGRVIDGESLDRYSPADWNP